MHRACIKLWEVTCIIAEETRSLRCEESRCGLEEDGKDLCCAFTRLRERGVYYDSMKHSRAITAQFQNEFLQKSLRSLSSLLHSTALLPPAVVILHEADRAYHQTTTFPGEA